MLILVAFMLIAVFSAFLSHHLFEKIPGLRRTMAAEANTTSQTVLRLARLLLAALMMVATVFKLDVVLGAFAAGAILCSLTPPGALEPFSKRLEALGFSFLIPLFFVCSGLEITVSVIWEQPLTLAGVVVGILLVRGLPVVLAEKLFETGSGLNTAQEQLQLELYASEGLPIIVAVTEVALANNLLSEQNASLLVAGGALTILLFPLWASAIGAVARGSSTPHGTTKTHSRELRNAKKQKPAAAVPSCHGRHSYR